MARTHPRFNPPLICVGISLAGIALWFAHEFATAKAPPFDGALDVSIHVLLGALKLATVCAFPFALRPFYTCLHRNPRTLVVFSVLAGAVYLGLFWSYAIWGRTAFAEFASGHVVRYYYLESEVLAKFGYLGLEEWQEQWRRFIPHVKELGLSLALGVFIVLCGYYYGDKTAAPFAVWGVVYFVLFVCPLILGLIVWDYDTFMGGIFFDALCLETFPLGLWWSGKTTIFLFALSGVFYFLLYIASRPRAAVRRGDTAT